MRTVVIQVAEPAKKGGGLPVELLSAESDEGPLTLVPQSRSIIPASLACGEEVREPGADLLTASRAQALYDTELDGSALLPVVGEYLHRTLLRGKTSVAWSQILHLAPHTPTRVLLDIASGPATSTFRKLPWELMYAPDTVTHPFLDRGVPFLRGRAVDPRARNPAVHVSAQGLQFPADDWPLRVLVVYGPDPNFAAGTGSAAGIGANQELRALETLFAASRFDVEFDVLEHPLPGQIVSACRTMLPHVLHFIGHGEAGGTPEQHRLLIYGDNRHGRNPPEYTPWLLQDIRNSLQRIPLRFAFLNACRTAASVAGGPSESPVPFGSVAEAFLFMGALGVLGMQGDIPGDLAAEFSRHFYSGLIANEPVDMAVAKARWEMSQLRAGVITQKSWSFPVLQTRVWPSLVLPRAPDGPCVMQPVERFAGRLLERRRVRDAACRRQQDPTSLPLESPHLIALVGDENAGKSHLAKWCLQVCARGGVRTAYVDFEQGKVDVLDALRQIRDGRKPPGTGQLTSLPNWPLPAAAFRPFNWELNQRMRGATLVQPLPEGAADIPDDGLALSATPNLPETFIDDTLHRFRLCLE
jgi:hypothetical protein